MAEKSELRNYIVNNQTKLENSGIRVYHGIPDHKYADLSDNEKYVLSPSSSGKKYYLYEASVYVKMKNDTSNKTNNLYNDNTIGSYGSVVKIESIDELTSELGKIGVKAYTKTEYNNNTKKSVAQLIETYVAKGKNQIIFTGAPGTGKTYSVREYVKKHTDNESEYKFVQFHPSYDYSDFVEGLRPVNVEGSDKPTFVRMDGSFKAFCRTIVENNLAAAGYSKDSQTLETLYKSISEKKKNKEKLNEQEAKFDKPEKKYYFIVDEINRADLAKVFGELMFGLEESYRGIENRFDTQYKNLVTYSFSKENKNAKAKPMDEVDKFDCFKKGFFIPKNLVFIGTMNDIDRSVESFDFALRRRFQWEEIKANDVMEDALWGMLEKGIIKTSINLSHVANGIKAMNKTLTPKNGKFGLSDAYHIGPAYFKKLSGSTIDEVKKSLEVIFDKNVQSIIREYLRGRNSKEVDDLVADCRKALLDGIDESIKMKKILI